MSNHRKINTLIRLLEEEQLEVEHLYALVKTTLGDTNSPTRNEYKVRAMKSLKSSANYLNETIQQLNHMRNVPQEKEGEYPKVQKKWNDWRDS